MGNRADSERQEVVNVATAWGNVVGDAVDKLKAEGKDQEALDLVLSIVLPFESLMRDSGDDTFDDILMEIDRRRILGLL
jgi:hypothetical protein